MDMSQWNSFVQSAYANRKEKKTKQNKKQIKSELLTPKERLHLAVHTILLKAHKGFCLQESQNCTLEKI
jgi:hypothetical protein